jgi:hypothetical protein
MARRLLKGDAPLAFLESLVHSTFVASLTTAALVTARTALALLGLALAALLVAAGAPTAMAQSAPAVRIAESAVSPDAHILYIGVSPAAAEVVLCESAAPAACTAQTSGAVHTRLVATRADRKVFQTDISVLLKPGSRWTVAALGAGGAAVETARFELSRAGGTGTGTGTGGGTTLTGTRIKVQDLSFDIPSGYKVHQDALARGTIIVGLTNGTDYLRIYVKQGAAPDMQRTFASTGAQVTRQAASTSFGGQSWTLMGTRKGSSTSVAAFSGERAGFSYWGFGASTSGDPAATVESFLRSAQ